MNGFVDIIRNYPLLSLFLVLGPLFGGLIGTYLGYDNLVTRLQNERQQNRIEARVNQIGGDLGQLSLPIETIRRYEKESHLHGQNLEILRRLLLQYDQLQNAISSHEEFIGKPDSQERIATAEHILKELRALIGATQFVPGPGGQALIIKTAPNTFRVTFAVPMRIPPDLTFSGLPAGVEAHVIEKTTIGFNVVFSPSAIPVETFGFEASARL